MSTRSSRHRVWAAAAVLVIIAGVIAAVVLVVASVQRPDRTVDGFARAAVGCTTTLDFTETGTFYVYAETSGAATDTGCEPLATEQQPFGFELTSGSDAIEPRRDDSISYDSEGRVGSSVAVVEIVDTGTYELKVVGDDVSTLAAIGRAPDAGVSDLRWAAAIAGLTGLTVGILILLMSRGRPSGPDGSSGNTAWAPPPWDRSTPPSATPTPDAVPESASPWAPPEQVDDRWHDAAMLA